MSDYSELTALIDAGNKAFEEFKKANDAQIAELKTKGMPSPDLTAKIEAIQADYKGMRDSMEKIELRMKRPGLTLDGSSGRVYVGNREIKGYVETEVHAEHRASFLGYLRKGQAYDTSIETKALSIGSGPDGGYALPKVIDAMIEQTIVNVSPIRQLAQVVQVSTPDYHKLVNIHGTSSGWVGESTARTETSTPALVDIQPPMGEIYAMPAATQTMLDDVFFNAEQWLADEVALEFARAEGKAFVSGTGVGQPKGFAAYTTAATADATRAFGTFEHVATGSSGAFKTTSSTVNPSDDLFTLVSKLKRGYRAGSTWVMNKNTLFAVMAFKDSVGRYIFNPTTAPGVDDTILGYPVVEAEDMADYTTASSLAIAFGNFRQGYIIVDRVGIRTIRDPFSSKPKILFYTTRREGGSAVNTEALKFLKFAAS